MELCSIVSPAQAMPLGDLLAWRDAVAPNARLRLIVDGPQAPPPNPSTADRVALEHLSTWLRRVAAAGRDRPLVERPPSTWPSALAPFVLDDAANGTDVVVYVTSVEVDPALVRETAERAAVVGVAHVAAEANGTTLVVAVSPSGHDALDEWIATGIAPHAVGATGHPEPDGVDPAPSRYEPTPGLVYDDVLAALAAEPGTPSPFTAPAAFVRRAIEPEVRGYAPISRYFMAARRRRHDLLVAFPEVPGRDAGAFLEWARSRGAEEHGVPVSAFAPPPPTPAPAPSYRQPGINLVGLVNAELGVGEVARRLERAMSTAHLPHAVTAFGATLRRQVAHFDDEPARFDTNLVCINAESLPAFTQEVGTSFYERHTIGLWFWETSHFPSMFDTCFAPLDELWAASDYIVDVLRAAAPPGLPVRLVPLPIVEPVCAADFEPSSLGIPNGRPYLLCSFDALSVPTRKNPLGAIDAFRKAFTEDDGMTLVVKSVNGQHRPDAMRTLIAAAAGRSDILLVDRALDAADNSALLAQSSCFVSVHRSEGYGLNLADALALGVPLVATGATGNMAFCSPDDCHLVRSTPVPVGPGNFPYEPDAMWMDPDLDHAASLLRAIAADPDAARATAMRAQRRVLAEHSLERTGAFLRDRVAIARADHESPAPNPERQPPTEPTLIERTMSRLRSLPLGPHR